MLPTGTPTVVNTTVTGFGVAEGSVMSALPLGLAGALTPATLEIVSVGVPATKTGPGGVPGSGWAWIGLEATVRLVVSYSRRIRPTEPLLPLPFPTAPVPVTPPTAESVPFPLIAVAR